VFDRSIRRDSEIRGGSGLTRSEEGAVSQRAIDHRAESSARPWRDRSAASANDPRLTVFAARLSRADDETLPAVGDSGNF